MVRQRTQGRDQAHLDRVAFLFGANPPESTRIQSEQATMKVVVQETTRLQVVSCDLHASIAFRIAFLFLAVH